MTTPPTFAEPEPGAPEGGKPAQACAAETRRARQLAMLQELAEIGMQMARAVRDEALARAEAAQTQAAADTAPAQAKGSDLGLVYSRIARAVRQTLALETRLADAIATAKVERARNRLAAARRAVDARQADIRDYVAEAIEAEAAERHTPDRDVERLLDDLDERLDDGDYDDVLADAPIGELVARICADLGVIPDWSLWDDQAWAGEHLKTQSLGDIGAERWTHLGQPPDPTALSGANGPPPDPG